MKILLSDPNISSDIHVIPLLKEEKLPSNLSQRAKKQIENIVTSKDFETKDEQTAFFYDDGHDKRILLVGLGEQKEIDEEKYLIAGANARKIIDKSKVKTMKITVDEKNLINFLLGFLLYGYKFDKYISKDPKDEKENIKIEKLFISYTGKNQKLLKEKIEEIEKLSESIMYLRDLVNAPANEITPDELANQSKKIAKMSRHISVKIFDRKKIQKMGMGALYSVGKGNSKGPYLIALEYKRKAKNKTPYAFVGKGITFDTGGLNLKPTNYIEDMHTDMAGAATVLATFYNLAKQLPNGYFVGVIAVAENSIGPDSTHPSDIIKSYNGQTIEITNTDAEGRLVLCDALTYTCKKYKPQFIIDLATLTGAAIVALGHEITALLSNNQKLADQIKNAGQKANERVWQLPLEKFHLKATKGKISDLVNWTSTMKCGTIMGAAFLAKFIENEIPWAHLDIAGTAHIDKPHGFYAEGATGVPLRTLWELIKSL